MAAFRGHLQRSRRYATEIVTENRGDQRRKARLKLHRKKPLSGGFVPKRVVQEWSHAGKSPENGLRAIGKPSILNGRGSQKPKPSRIWDLSGGFSEVEGSQVEADGLGEGLQDLGYGLRLQMGKI